ncbi:translation initiation factor eIF-2B subunit family protein [Aspergillus eucalypticola CBS 122712]|uniref:Translation initiation factor eIF-2B subunit family protein n=1 Tax=Aspergillus eucalypticola (strain CBS 122712 / IBT 29274) TaxID=1448314 RepID=A0A317UKI6_ASPEC|nr:translation initiation factor eIF-2B subunit family protein [Aspergillus eucalypticola CBS 122712]PWY61905.1 translation initiation factor eIF-2B subunit family protein [Aspergillus eucalypticola CBS 122712]
MLISRKAYSFAPLFTCRIVHSSTGRNLSTTFTMSHKEQPHESQLEKRAVVSSFIFYFPKGPSEKPVVALFKRSDKVRTYSHHLAPISGSISRSDNFPIEAAWRELAEETSLDQSSLIHWRTGKSFTFEDRSVNREWTVHPFAFKLKDPSEGGKGESAIKIDWEHEGWEWYDPQSVLDREDLEIVPRLKDSLRRVWFEGELSERAAKALSLGLERLRSDHESGAQELTAIALVAFRDFIVQTQDEINSEEWWKTVRMAAWHIIKNGRESMGASTLNALIAVLDEIKDILVDEQTNSQHKLERVLNVLDHHLKCRKSRQTQVKDAFANYIRFKFLHHGEALDKLTILTVSASSTIRDSILEAYASLDIRKLELRILESRPLFEGTSIGSSIVSNFKSRFLDTPGKELKVKIYTDASAALAAANVDLLLLGADRISSTKGVSNKTGSLPAVLCTKHVSPGAQIAVLSDLEKINCVGSMIDDDHHEDNDPMEVISAWHNDGVKAVRVLEDGMKEADAEGSSTVEVKNTYFEWVPLYMVDAFVSEEGVMDESRIRERSKQLGETVNRFFEDL